MSDNTHDQPKILGNRSGLCATDLEITDWSPPPQQALVNRTPLPPPRPRLEETQRPGPMAVPTTVSPSPGSSPRPGHILADSLRGRVRAQA